MRVLGHSFLQVMIHYVMLPKLKFNANLVRGTGSAAVRQGGGSVDLEDMREVPCMSGDSLNCGCTRAVDKFLINFTLCICVFCFNSYCIHFGQSPAVSVRDASCKVAWS